MAEGPYRIELLKQAIRDYRKYQSSQYREAIDDALETLSKDPKNCPASTRMINFKCEYRYRVGSLRILYDVIDSEIAVLVVAIEPRGQVYNKKNR